MAVHLRVFRPADDDAPSRAAQHATVPVRLADLLPLVALADRRQAAWLSDFLDDEVRITGDLHDVLEALRGRRPTA